MDIESAAIKNRQYFLPNIQDPEFLKKVSLTPNNDQIKENGVRGGYKLKIIV